MRAAGAGPGRAVDMVVTARLDGPVLGEHTPETIADTEAVVAGVRVEVVGGDARRATLPELCRNR